MRHLTVGPDRQRERVPPHELHVARVDVYRKRRGSLKRGARRKESFRRAEKGRRGHEEEGEHAHDRERCNADGLARRGKVFGFLKRHRFYVFAESPDRCVYEGVRRGRAFAAGELEEVQEAIRYLRESLADLAGDGFLRRPGQQPDELRDRMGQKRCRHDQNARARRDREHRAGRGVEPEPGFDGRRREPDGCHEADNDACAPGGLGQGHAAERLLEARPKAFDETGSLLAHKVQARRGRGGAWCASPANKPIPDYMLPSRTKRCFWMED